MRPGAATAAAVAAFMLCAGGFVAGQRSAVPAQPGTVIRERIVGPAVPAARGCDEEEIAAAVARALEVRPSPPPPPPPAPRSAAADSALARAEDVLDGAQATGRWSERDADELRAAMRDMSPEDRVRAMSELSGALNRGELRADVLPPL